MRCQLITLCLPEAGCLFGIMQISRLRWRCAFRRCSARRAAEGRVPLVLELLSPAQWSLQITRDWRGAYLEVQKEMKGRYSRHPWPDDPASALEGSAMRKR